MAKVAALCRSKHRAIGPKENRGTLHWYKTLKQAGAFNEDASNVSGGASHILKNIAIFL
jgi:hypothetical protein